MVAIDPIVILWVGVAIIVMIVWLLNYLRVFSRRGNKPYSKLPYIPVDTGLPIPPIFIHGAKYNIVGYKPVSKDEKTGDGEISVWAERGGDITVLQNQPINRFKADIWMAFGQRSYIRYLSDTEITSDQGEIERLNKLREEDQMIITQYEEELERMKKAKGVQEAYKVAEDAKASTNASMVRPYGSKKKEEKTGSGTNDEGEDEGEGDEGDEI